MITTETPLFNELAGSSAAPFAVIMPADGATPGSAARPLPDCPRHFYFAVLDGTEAEAAVAESRIKGAQGVVIDIFQPGYYYEFTANADAQYGAVDVLARDLRAMSGVSVRCHPHPRLEPHR